LDGLPDPRGEFTILVSDLAMIPIAGAAVTIQFNACEGTPRVCLAAEQPDLDVISVSPDGSMVTAVTPGDGTVRLTLVGSVEGTAGTSCALVFGDGVNLGMVPSIAAFDLDGAGGVRVPDVSMWLQESFAPDYRGRADYDCSGTITPADLALLLGVSLAGGSANSATGALCH
jgi:hypothetical protein